MSDTKVYPIEALRGLVSRRRFCQGAATGIALATIPGCLVPSGGERIGTGPFDNGDGGSGPEDFANSGPRDFAGQGPLDFSSSGNPDFHTNGNPDFRMSGGNPDLRMSVPPDMHMATQGNCPSGITDTGKTPSSFGVNTATFYSRQEIFVCRDSGGLFALTSVCTHAGCDVTWRSSSMYFYCPCHGARFSYTGGELTSISNGPLVHVPLCLTSNGTVGFDANQTVSDSTRYNF